MVSRLKSQRRLSGTSCKYEKRKQMAMRTTAYISLRPQVPQPVPGGLLLLKFSPQSVELVTDSTGAISTSQKCFLYSPVYRREITGDHVACNW